MVVYDSCDRTAIPTVNPCAALQFDVYKMTWASEPTDDEYIDCYADDKKNRIMKRVMVDKAMTSSMCREKCVGTGAAAYATQVRQLTAVPMMVVQ